MVGIGQHESVEVIRWPVKYFDSYNFIVTKNHDFAALKQLITSIRLLSNNEISIPIFLLIHRHPNRSFFLLNPKCAYKIYHGSSNRSFVHYKLTISWKRDWFDGSWIPRIQSYSIHSMMKTRQHIGKSLENFVYRQRKNAHSPTHVIHERISSMLVKPHQDKSILFIVFTEISTTNRFLSHELWVILYDWLSLTHNLWVINGPRKLSLV